MLLDLGDDLLHHLVSMVDPRTAVALACTCSAAPAVDRPRRRLLQHIRSRRPTGLVVGHYEVGEASIVEDLYVTGMWYDLDYAF